MSANGNSSEVGVRAKNCPKFSGETVTSVDVKYCSDMSLIELHALNRISEKENEVSS